MSTHPKLLSEISILRPLLIILLVVYHAFIIYRGGWNPPIGYLDNQIYWWIATIAYSNMLEMFTFISGYVWSYQIYERMKTLQIGELFNSKFKRLIIPSIVFSFVYVLLFGIDSSDSPFIIGYHILCGYGHMWYLPMLFWCFMGVFLLEKIHVKERYKLIFLLCCAIVSYLPLPLRISSAMYYIVFFYAGFYVRKQIAGKPILINKARLFVLWILFIVLFIALTLQKEALTEIDTSDVILKAFVLSLSKLYQITYATLGVIATFCTALYIASRIELKSWIINIGNSCFGVYLFQQFILMGIYYHTALPSIVGSIWLPWAGFVIIMAGSLFLTWLFRQTKLGKKLI